MNFIRISDDGSREGEISGSDEDYFPSSNSEDGTMAPAKCKTKTIPLKTFLHSLEEFRHKKNCDEPTSTTHDEIASLEEENSHDGHDPDFTEERNSIKVNADSISTEEADSTSTDNLTVNTKREKKWDKQKHCKFCLKSVQKLPRHLEVMHGKEEEVRLFVRKKILIANMKVQLSKLKNNKDSFPFLLKNIDKVKDKTLKEGLKEMKKVMKEKDDMIAKIRSDGGYIYNRRAIMTGKGELYTKRRPVVNSKCTSADYLPCPTCKEFFLKHSLFRHRTLCNPSHKKGSNVQCEAHLLLPTTIKTNELFQRDILESLTSDHIGCVVRSDELILARGQKIYEKRGSGRDHRNTICEKMRELGRFLIAMRQICDNDSKSLTSCLKACQVPNVIKAVRQIAGYNTEKQRYITPTLAIKTGHNINACVSILEGQLAQREDVPGTQSINFFKKALEERWAVEVSCGAFRTLKMAKWNKLPTTPTADDVRKFNV